ncbi:unnamed protein product [Brachionus calyciflorus]|uniref:CYTH domain-containing protein n=1 Tax=Brachionus calyciflorus TaxID=104777 RepID=A0A813XRY8_9BILA|nr:unnamed protein product [Brachionus calyciflorus]
MTTRRNLEIEKKFFYSANLEQKLKDLNAKEESVIEMVDTYLDNSDSYFLILNDFWLRSRKIGNLEPKWELKYPSKIKSTSHEKNFNKYFETNDQTEIIHLISTLIGNNFDLNSKLTKAQDINEMINVLNLKPFSLIKTTRKVFSFDRISIDLDETDFDYKIAELEIVLQGDLNQNEIDLSIQQIDNFAIKLGKYKKYLKNTIKRLQIDNSILCSKFVGIFFPKIENESRVS